MDEDEEAGVCLLRGGEEGAMRDLEEVLSAARRPQGWENAQPLPPKSVATASPPPSAPPLEEESEGSSAGGEGLEGLSSGSKSEKSSRAELQGSRGELTWDSSVDGMEAGAVGGARQVPPGPLRR